MLKHLNKDDYRKMCGSNNLIPTFFQDWWLDIVCGKGNWDIVYHKIHDHTLLLLPYFIENKGRFKISRQPPLTPFLGPVIISNLSFNLTKEYHYHKLLLNDLPEFDFFCQKWSINNLSWYPYFRNDFNQTTSYTYLIEGLKNQENIYNSYSPDIRKSIDEATEKYHCGYNTSVKGLFQFQRQIFERQNSKFPIREQQLQELVSIIISKNLGFVLSCYDEHEQEVGAILIVYDRDVGYNLVQGVDSKHYKSGVSPYLIHNAIKISTDRVHHFNFEGSMIPQVESFFRKFGGRQIPYNIIYKDNKKLISLLRIFFGKFRIR